MVDTAGGHGVQNVVGEREYTIVIKCNQILD